MSAGGDVARPQVGDDRKPGCLRDPGRLPDLQRAEAPASVHPVEHRLPGRDHEVGAPAGQLRDAKHGRRGERLAGEGVQLAQLPDRGLGRREHGEQPLAEIVRPWRLAVTQRAQHDPAARIAVALEAQISSRDVDGVHRRARAHRNDDHGAAPVVAT